MTLFADREVDADVRVVVAAVISHEIASDVAARGTAHIRRPAGVALAAV